MIRAETEHEAPLDGLAQKEVQAPRAHRDQMVYQPVPEHLAYLAILGLPEGLDDLDALDLRVIRVDLGLQAGKENQENQGLDSKDCRVILVTEEVLDVQV